MTQFRPLSLAAHLAILLTLLPPWPAAVNAAGCEARGPLPGEARLPPDQRALLALARELPLDVKLGQLLLLGFVGTAPDAGLRERVARGHLGGLFLLARNVRDRAQVQALTAGLSDAVAGASLGLRPFLATDFEGGPVNPLRAVTGATSAAAAMAADGVEPIQARGAADARTLRSLGFNANLAPVVDVLSERSDVIGDRSFSSDPAAAAALGRAYLRGLQGAGVLGVLKHFPGHGATAGDSHVALPTVDRSLAALDAADLVPYRQAIAAGEAQAVMVGHLLVPALDPTLPASLSRPVVAGLLRDRLAFGGLALTDELKMGAISRSYDAPQAALLAIQAGVDVILADYTGAEQEAVLQALARACLAGHLPEGRLETSAARVLRAKHGFGLLGPELAGRYAARVAGLGAAVPDSAPGQPAPAALAAPAADLGGRPLAALPPGVGGRLYVEAAGGDFGYAIADEDGAALWEGYVALGGPDRLGYPLSQRFEFQGRPAQLTQRALLLWDADQGAATVANAFELLADAGALLGWPGCDPPGAPDDGDRAAGGGVARRAECRLDGWLEQQGTPPAAGPTFDDFRRAVAIRLAWLDNDAIRAAFLADPADGPAAPWPEEAALDAGLDGVPDDAMPWAAVERYGLPASRPVRYGPFVAQRFQRAAFQLWLDEAPGAPPPGTVTQVLAGELLRAAGFVPAAALIPIDLDGAPGPPPAFEAAPLPSAPASPALPSPTVTVPPIAPASPTQPPPSTTPTPSPVSAQPTPTHPARVTTASATAVATHAPTVTATPRPPATVGSR